MSGYKTTDTELEELAIQLNGLLHAPINEEMTYSDKLRAISTLMNSYSNTDNTLDDLIEFLDEETFELYTKYQFEVLRGTLDDIRKADSEILQANVLIDKMKDEAKHHPNSAVTNTIKFLLFKIPSPETFADKMIELSKKAKISFEYAQNYITNKFSETIQFYKNTYEQISYVANALKTDTDPSEEFKRTKQFLFGNQGNLLLTYHFDSKKFEFSSYLDGLINEKILEQIREKNPRDFGKTALYKTTSMLAEPYTKLQQQAKDEIGNQTLRTTSLDPRKMPIIPDKVFNMPQKKLSHEEIIRLQNASEELFSGLSVQEAQNEEMKGMKGMNDNVLQFVPSQVQNKRIFSAKKVDRGPKQQLDLGTGKRKENVVDENKRPKKQAIGPNLGGKTRRKVRRNKKTKTKKRKVNKKTKKRKRKMKSKRKTNKRRTKK